MPKKYFKRFAPSPEYVKAHPSLNRLAHLLEDPNLFHLNRYSVPMSFLVGVFWAFMPVPLQMLFAAIVALWVRCNLPIALTLVWITNPLTLGPIYYSTYLLGTWLLEVPPMSFPDGLSFDAIWQELGMIWKPFVIGCLAAGSFLSLTSYALVKACWRLFVIYQWRKRKARHLRRGQRKTSQLSHDVKQ